MRCAWALLAVATIACNSTSDATSGGTTSVHPDPSQVGHLTVRADTGAAIVGRQLHVQVSGTDASGGLIDASSAELTASNPSVAQLVSAIAIPIGTPPTNFYNLSATFALTSAGTTAIRARLGILTDSIIITVIPPT
jgi:hypothetical protein